MSRRVTAHELALDAVRKHLLSANEAMPSIPVDSLSGMIRGKPAWAYHYTEISGLLGIISSNSLLATDVRFLNDWTELSHGVDILEGAFREFREGLKDPTERKITGGLDLRALWLDHRVFVCSMSERGDQLSQWRSYSRSSQGYALGFETAALADLHVASSSMQVIPVRMDYGEGGHLSLAYVRGVLNAFKELAAEGRPVPMASARRWIAETLLAESLRFKNEAFHEEQELRIAAIARAGEKLPVTHVSRGGMPVPCVAIQPRGGRLPLRRVIVGPGQNSNAAYLGVKSLMAANAIDNVSVEVSATPYRP